MELNLYHIVFILFIPLGGSIAALIVNRKYIPAVSSGFIGLGLAGALWLVLRTGEYPFVYHWEWLPGIQLGVGADRIIGVLVGLVLFISFLVHVFSAYYMEKEEGLARYYAKLGFFTFSMLGLLFADHILLLFIFWELVGFSSYLLIGYWYKDPEKATAARAAFMINRVADAGLLIGVILLMIYANSPFLSQLERIDDQWVNLVGVCLAIGAFGKSAQFPFFGWLPKAMAGPTPVSALIHAATMVAAGVYLLIRVEPVLTPEIKSLVALIGGLTAFMAGIAALTQHDIKKVLAYSTISQLGYMILGIGVGAFQSSLFHLWTHAFFKAGLFLGSGVVIHYIHHAAHSESIDAQDMRKMGGLFTPLPATFYTFLICGMALSGLPFFSGFLSKEGIITGAWVWGETHGGMSLFLPVLALITAFLTPTYMARLLFLVFFGKSRLDIPLPQYKEPLMTVKIPLIVLAVSSLWFWHALNPLDSHGWLMSEYIFHNQKNLETITLSWLMYLSVVLAIGGIVAGYFIYHPGSIRVTSYRQATVPEGTIGKLSFYSWYIDLIYNAINFGVLKIARGVSYLDRKVIDPTIDFIGILFAAGAKVVGWTDRYVVDGSVNFTAGLAAWVGRRLASIQSPSIQAQLTWLILALIIILIWFNFS